MLQYGYFVRSTRTLSLQDETYISQAAYHHRLDPDLGVVGGAAVVAAGFGLGPFLPVLQMEHRMSAPAIEFPVDAAFDGFAIGIIRVKYGLA